MRRQKPDSGSRTKWLTASKLAYASVLGRVCPGFG